MLQVLLKDFIKMIIPEWKLCHRSKRNKRQYIPPGMDSYRHLPCRWILWVAYVQYFFPFHAQQHIVRLGGLIEECKEEKQFEKSEYIVYI